MSFYALFFNACKLICHNKAHVTVIMKFIRRKWNGNGSEIELFCDYVKRKTFLFVDFFNFTLYFFFFYPPAFFWSFTTFSAFSFVSDLFASFCRNAAVEVKLKAMASDWDTCLHTCTHSSKLAQAHVLFSILMCCHVLPRPLLLLLLC